MPERRPASAPDRSESPAGHGLLGRGQHAGQEDVAVAHRAKPAGQVAQALVQPPQCIARRRPAPHGEGRAQAAQRDPHLVHGLGARVGLHLGGDCEHRRGKMKRRVHQPVLDRHRGRQRGRPAPRGTGRLVAGQGARGLGQRWCRQQRRFGRQPARDRKGGGGGRGDDQAGERGLGRDGVQLAVQYGQAGGHTVDCQRQDALAALAGGNGDQLRIDREARRRGVGGCGPQPGLGLQRGQGAGKPGGLVRRQHAAQHLAGAAALPGQLQRQALAGQRPVRRVVPGQLQCAAPGAAGLHRRQRRAAQQPRELGGGQCQFQRDGRRGRRRGRVGGGGGLVGLRHGSGPQAAASGALPGGRSEGARNRTSRPPPLSSPHQGPAIENSVSAQVG